MIVVTLTIFITIQYVSFFPTNFVSSDGYVPLIIPNSIFIIETPKKFIEGNIDSRERYINMKFSLDPELTSVYNDIGLDNNAVVIYPTFTETAYSENGFYDFYENLCNEECLTVPIKENFRGEFESGKAAYHALKTLGYETLTDVDVDKNPQILNNFGKVILLHNEYVTKSMFEAITNHPKVIYLYPNALYAEILVDYDQGTISLNHGHNYPSNEISNGFDWEFDNTHPFEYDTKCIDWEFYEIKNGVMLNCYPEYIMYKDIELLKKITEF